MHNVIKNTIGKALAVIAVVTASAACSVIDLDFVHESSSGGTKNHDSRLHNIPEQQVFIFMAFGYNNLSSYLAEDILELSSNYLPSNTWRSDVVLVFSHFTDGDRNYTTKTSPTLTRLYKDYEGKVQKDTLLVMDKSTISADAETVRSVLTYIKNEFPAKNYGMLLSSHGTGWVPENYCNNPDKFENSSKSVRWMAPKWDGPTPKPFLEDLSVNGGPAVKSIGVQNISKSEMIEMDITDIVDAIPMKMDYILFDACFMGGIEVAYEFREKCDKMVFSQTEILADGMDYNTMLSYLLNDAGPDLEGLCENFFQYYNSQTGQYQSATISLVDCRKLTPLAEACRTIFEANRERIAKLEGNSSIQKYYRKHYSDIHRWFFDLYDIAQNSGASTSQLNALKAALDECIIYKAATEKVIDIPITTHSGLSMYLPYKNRTYLNNFYKTLEWNKATGLVQ